MNSYEEPSLSYQCDLERHVDRLKARIAELEGALRSAIFSLECVKKYERGGEPQGLLDARAALKVSR